MTVIIGAVHPPKLTDELVVMMRKLSRENADVSSGTLAKETGISVNTLSKAIRGDTFKHLNHIEAPYSKSPFKVSDEDVIAMRNMASAATHQEVYSAFSHLNIHPSTIEKIVRGDVYKHLNTIAPPVKKTVSKSDLKEKARLMCQSGVSYANIVKSLGVSIASVSGWCSDIVRPKKSNNISVKPVCEKRPKIDRDRVILLWTTTVETQREIAQTMGINISTVNRICSGHDKEPGLVRDKKKFPLIGPKGQGPYVDWHMYFSSDKHGAKIVHLVHGETRERVGMRYARYLMSVHLNRVLDNTEVVKYKDGIVDDINNLEIVIIRQDPVVDSVGKTKVCKQCKVEFESKSNYAKYCSTTCRNMFNDARDKVARTCRGCKSEFSSDSRSQRYCGTECRDANGPPKHPERLNRPKKKDVGKIECVVCEGKFTPNTPDRDYCYSAHCVSVIENEAEE